MIGTMTAAQAAQVMREMGIRVSPQTIREGLEQGKYPFGECIEKKSGRNVYHIYTRLFEEWLEGRIDQEGEEE